MVLDVAKHAQAAEIPLERGAIWLGVTALAEEGAEMDDQAWPPGCSIRIP